MTSLLERAETHEVMRAPRRPSHTGAVARPPHGSQQPGP